MNNYLTVLKALFKNKLRFGDSISNKKKAGFLVVIGLVYVAVMAMFITMFVELGNTGLLMLPEVSLLFYIFIMLTTAVVVLIFGIINLIGTLYLSKDTDFYSMLPVKSSVVFAAKLSFVYISEAMITAAIVIPLMITFGVMAEMWAGFYLISIFTIVLVPAIPLVLAAIVSIPVMFIASKLKNRGVISLIFYLILFGALFGVYIYFIYSATDITGFDEDTFEDMIISLDAMLYVFYPYTVLALAACRIPSIGMAPTEASVGASVAANLAIFIGISAVLLAVILLLSKFMYSQSAKANNQTDNSSVKKGEFKSSSATKALMKREFLGSLRTTQVAFQCYATMIIPAVFAVIIGIVCRNVMKVGDLEGVEDIVAVLSEVKTIFTIMGFSVLTMMIATLNNASATTFSREGSAFASLKAMPLSAKQVIKGKVGAWLAIGVPAATVAVVILNIFIFDWLHLLLSLFSLVPLSAAFIVFGALWDLSSPKIKWVDPIQAVKHNGHTTIGQFICMAGGFAAVVIGNILMNFVETDVLFAIFWAMIYGILAVFTVTDILMLRNAERNYNRIEI